MCGFLCHWLALHFTRFSYTGVDRLPEALNVAREHFPRASFIEADFSLGEFPEHDYVVLSNVPFQSANEITSAISNLLPVMRRRFFLIRPNSDVEVIERRKPDGGTGGGAGHIGETARDTCA